MIKNLNVVAIKKKEFPIILNKILNYISLFNFFLLLVFVASREIRYLPFDIKIFTGNFFGEFLSKQSLFYFNRSLELYRIEEHQTLIIASVLVISLLIIFIYFFYEKYITIISKIILTILLSLLVMHNFLFDINSYLFNITFGLLIIAILLKWSPDINLKNLFTKKILWIIYICLIAIGTYIAQDLSDRIALLIWIICVLFCFYLFRKLETIINIAILVMSLLIPQFISIILPVVIPVHNGHFLGDGQVFSFCQSPKNNHIFASIPNCPTILQDDNTCGSGFIAEYDSNHHLIEKHHVFNNNDTGRFEQLICLEDSLIIGLVWLRKGNITYAQNVIEYNLTNKKYQIYFKKRNRCAQTAVYDELTDMVYLAGEESYNIYKFDRKKQKLSSVIKLPGWSHMTYTDSKHKDRRSIFFYEFLMGKRAYEFAIENNKILKIFDVNNGGSWGGTADEKMNRYYITGTWGMDVFDIDTGKRINLKRLGFISKSPVIDHVHNLLFVPSSVEGKIRIYNQKNLKIIKTIPIGYGVRHLLISNDSKYLYASSKNEHFFWEIDTLI